MMYKAIKFSQIVLLIVFCVTGASGQQSVQDQEGNYLVCEKMPEIEGGLKALQKKIRYPLQAKSLGVQGVVYVQFIVNTKGEIETPTIIRKLGAGKRSRTSDLLITNQLLYQLSYSGV